MTSIIVQGNRVANNYAHKIDTGTLYFEFIFFTFDNVVTCKFLCHAYFATEAGTGMISKKYKLLYRTTIWQMKLNHIWWQNAVFCLPGTPVGRWQLHCHFIT